MNQGNQKHLFVIDPIESLNLALDSSLRMAFELTQLGHEVAFCDVARLARRSTGGALGGSVARAFGSGYALASTASFPDGPTKPRIQPPRARELGEFAAIHMRKDPPYDLDYVAATWLLDGAPASTRIYNAPHALRSFNEKLAIFMYPDECRSALVSADPEELLTFIVETVGGDAILKPLLLFGGRGVRRLRIGDDSRESLLQKLNAETVGGRSPRLVQAFDPEIANGEVRAFALGGKALAWCLKKPAPGEFLANTRAGATLHPYEPGPKVLARVERVAGDLAAKGAPVVGFDLIGGWISEINLTSPRLLQAPGDNTNYYQRFAEWMSRDVTKDLK